MNRVLLVALTLVAAAAIVWAANSGAAGLGVIKVSDRTAGKFNFTVVKQGDAVRGTLTFNEVAPARQNALIAHIDMKAERLACDANTAQFGGKGYLNRKPVFVVVKVADNRAPDGTSGDPDFLSIVATAPDGTQVYAARGALARGDIKVRTGR